ncbi:hypothetical protein [Bradyrhizobium sp. SZCCHNR1002]|uniref:hypothetical protein n=1 Tax=unclassified Bradyrhizobium TaxID=2631580 RepID=UPI0039655BC4
MVITVTVIMAVGAGVTGAGGAAIGAGVTIIGIGGAAGTVVIIGDRRRRRELSSSPSNYRWSRVAAC